MQAGQGNSANSGSAPTCSAGSTSGTCSTAHNVIYQDNGQGAMQQVVIAKPNGLVMDRPSKFGVTPADREVATMIGLAANGIPFERPLVWGYRGVQT